MYKLKIINSTVRDGRKGSEVAKWVGKQVKNFNQFEIEVIDLGTINLPLNTEPNPPASGIYTQEHTKNWSKTINEADAFIFVMAEYNHSYPAAIKNALDYLSAEWAYKPVAFVSYAGISGGTRSVNDLANVVTTLKLVPIVETVCFPLFWQHHNEESGLFEPQESSEKSAKKMLTELLLWTEGLKEIRKKIR